MCVCVCVCDINNYDLIPGAFSYIFLTFCLADLVRFWFHCNPNYIICAHKTMTSH